MRLVLDAGALLALERGDRSLWALVKDALAGGSVPLTHGGVIGQVWRGKGPRQARLAQALAGVEVVPLDASLGRKAGELLARTGGSDVIDAAIALLAAEGDVIVTSDRDDLEPLAAATGRQVAVHRV